MRPAGPAARHESQIDAKLMRALSHRRRSQRSWRRRRGGEAGAGLAGAMAAPARRALRRIGQSALGAGYLAREAVSGAGRAAHRWRRCPRHRPRTPPAARPPPPCSPGVPCSATTRAGHRRGHFHRRLVGHHVDQRLVLRDPVADRDVPGDDLGLGRAFADIGQLEDDSGPSLSPPSRGAALRHARGPGK